MLEAFAYIRPKKGSLPFSSAVFDCVGEKVALHQILEKRSLHSRCGGSARRRTERHPKAAGEPALLLWSVGPCLGSAQDAPEGPVTETDPGTFWMRLAHAPCGLSCDTVRLDVQSRPRLTSWMSSPLFASPSTAIRRQEEHPPLFPRDRHTPQSATSPFAVTSSSRS